MKKTLLIFSFLLCFLFAGCGKSEQSLPQNSIYAGVALTENGAIIQTMSFPTFSKEVETTEIKRQTYIADLIKSIENEIYNNFYLKYWVKYLEAPNEKYVIGGEYVKFFKPAYDIQKDAIFFHFVFGGMPAWRYYNSTSNSDENEPDGGFIITHTTEASFPFSAKDQNGKTAGEIYKNVVKTAFFHHFNQQNLPECDFVYEYKSASKRLHSNADIVRQEEGLYAHAWVLNEEEVGQGKEVRIWQNQANSAWWYLLVLAGGLVGVGVAFGALYLKRKRKTKVS